MERSQVEMVLDKVRGCCNALPEVHERLSHGEPAWFVQGKRLFATFMDHHHDDRVGVVCAALTGVQESIIAEDSLRFYRPAYVGAKGWIGIDLSGDVDWTRVELLLHEAFLCVAPARLAQRIGE